MNNETYLITGATGLIGVALTKQIVANGDKVIAAVRNPAKAMDKFAKIPNVKIVQWTATDGIIDPVALNGLKIDFIIHAASNTSSVAFIESPLDVINETISGANNIIELARAYNVKGVILLSTMETYGLTNSENVTETDYAQLDPMIPRNCYPEAKRLAECMLASAVKQYGIRAMVARLTQTFGTGIEKNDNRVFAQFARAAKSGCDIILKSEGKTARCYCGLNDAVEGILTIAKKGEAGVSYNVANPDTYCTIREMAEMVAEKFSKGKTKVVIDLSNAEKCGYLPTFKMKLNIDRLKKLGWEPKQSLFDMYSEIIKEFD